MSQARNTLMLNSTTRKNGGLWSYILPPSTTASSSPPDPDATGQIPPSTSILPATGPSDRSAMSVRLMLSDAKAALQQLSERVERVADEAGNARREVAETGRGVEEAQAGMVKQVQTIVKQAIMGVQEANATHTSSLEAALARIANLEVVLAAQATAISDLGRTCLSNQSNITTLLDRVTQTHAAVLSLSPTIPLLQGIPAEIVKAQLSTTNAMEHLQAETLRAARDARVEFSTLSEEQKRAALGAVSELFGSRDQLWQEKLDVISGQVQKELEKCREDWMSALSTHRQEVCGLLSVRLATCTHANAHTTMDGAQTRSQPSHGMELPPNPQASLERDQPGRFDASHASSSALRQSGRPPHISITSEAIQRASSEMVEELLGFGDAISGIGNASANPAENQHTHTNTDIRSDQNQNSTHERTTMESLSEYPHGSLSESRLEPATEMESQTSALTSLPDLDADEREIEDSQNTQTETQEGSASGGLLFGALNKPSRTRSAHQDFATPDSPPFSLRRRRLSVVGKSSHLRISSTSKPSPTSSISRIQTSANSAGHSPTIVASPPPASIQATPAPTLGRSLESASLHPNTIRSPASTLQKRVHELQRPGLAKRPKTRKLMTAEECALDEE
ncbi:hypothetical protein FRC12_000424 [Ceratobasidium sp. 428]|nr:hypothetical protein FRC12_000424 [Ceratobasidium sp. 428]